MKARLTWGTLALGAAFCAGTLGAAEVEIGAKAPDFKAVGVDGKPYSLANAAGAKVTVICFTCNACPVAVAYEDRFIEFVKKYSGQPVTFIALNCNNKTENLQVMKQRSDTKGFNFPYAFDASGDAARAYGARVTPHLFVLDADGKVAYRGSFDDKMKDPKQHFVVDAVEALLAGKQPAKTSTDAFGCSIKLK